MHAIYSCIFIQILKRGMVRTLKSSESFKMEVVNLWCVKYGRMIAATFFLLFVFLSVFHFACFRILISVVLIKNNFRVFSVSVYHVPFPDGSQRACFQMKEGNSILSLMWCSSCSFAYSERIQQVESVAFSQNACCSCSLIRI